MGCVFVQKVGESGNGDRCTLDLNARVLSSGCNATNASRNGTRHAELVAIDDLLLRQGRDPAVLRGCELYVTCEVIFHGQALKV